MTESRIPESPLLISLEEQHRVAYRLLTVSVRALGGAAGSLADGMAEFGAGPSPRQLAQLDDLMGEVRRRWQAWDSTRTQLGEHRRDDRRRT
jgi:hypothetical protein